MYYLLFYEKAPNFADTETPHRQAHLEYVQAAARNGELLLAGSLAEPTDGAAVLLFRCESSATVEQFAVGDPYVRHGFVCRWHWRVWDLVIGSALRVI